MDDNDLREMFRQWAEPLGTAVPPPLPAVMRRARRRTARIAVAAVTAAAVLAVSAIQAAHVLGAGRQNPPVAPGPRSNYAEAPYYIAASSDGSKAGVWNAVTGKKLATIAAPAESSAIGRSPTIWAD